MENVVFGGFIFYPVECVCVCVACFNYSCIVFHVCFALISYKHLSSQLLLLETVSTSTLYGVAQFPYVCAPNSVCDVPDYSEKFSKCVSCIKAEVSKFFGMVILDNVYTTITLCCSN
jgi:hypothetical protein